MPSAISRTLTGNSPSLDHDTKVLINMIFARFHHIYTHRFESAYRDETTLNQAKREWALSLAGMSANLIELALERCKREHAWPPTIAEFLKLTQPTPESLGLPSVAEAYLEACQHSHQPSRHNWSNLCVQLAARDVGYFLLRSEPERSSRPLFEKKYQAIMNRLANGETLSVEESLAELPSPDLHEEADLLAQLKAQKIDDIQATKLAYYLEKPKGSELRKRYRKHALQLAEQWNLTVQLPE